MRAKGNLGKLDIGECEDITGKPTPPRPAHRPRDNVRIWTKHVEIALAMEGLRKSGRTYEEAVATVAEELHASEATVKRAYGMYSLEPGDPNSAEKRRKWSKKRVRMNDG